MTSAETPKRIAFCITELDPGGAERALVNLVLGLDRTQWEPSVYCLGPRGILAEPLEEASIPVTCLGTRSKLRIGVILRLAKELRQLKPKILQTFLFHGNIAGRIAAKLAGVEHVISGIRVAEKRSRLPLWIDRATNRLVDHNVCVSQSVADFSIKQMRLPRTKVSVIPNGVDFERFSQALPASLADLHVPTDARVLLAVGRLDRQKGSLVLLEAFAEIPREFEQLHLMFVGDGPLKNEINAWIQHRKLEGRIHLLGWRPDIPAIMKSSHALVLASRWEGMPNVLLEAMAAGIPIVATRVEGVDEIIRSHNFGILVPPESPHELAEGIRKLMRDPTSAAAMASAAQHMVADEFTLSSVVSRYEQLYQSILLEPPVQTH